MAKGIRGENGNGKNTIKSKYKNNEMRYGNSTECNDVGYLPIIKILKFNLFYFKK